METPSSDFHVEYPLFIRHWSPLSENYAGADCLVTAIQKGWRVTGDIYNEEFWHAGTRLTCVFHFTLKRGDETVVMPVISNPFARRLIFQNRITLRPIEERAQQTIKSQA
ncbi:hypothetical protein ANRL1_03747 [Anaerolineae bacterium]|nr:hypothetical protein ANRL1_03747 [Anaerolineae bacterium]